MPCGVHPDRVNGFQTGVVKVNLSADAQPEVVLDHMAQYIFAHNRAASGTAWNTTLNFG